MPLTLPFTDDKTKIAAEFVENALRARNALTPADKLRALRELEQLATVGDEDGKIQVPASPTEILRLPASHPAVQAVVRGDAVSIAGNAAISLRGMAGLTARFKKLPLWQKVAIVLSTYLVLVGVIQFGMGLMSGPAAVAAQDAPAPTASPTPNASPIPAEVGGVVTPTPAATATALGDQVILNNDPPAPMPSNPVSLEVGTHSFVLAMGVVSDAGVWMPRGPEWLAGTDIRRVLALPLAGEAADVEWRPGDELQLRLRDGSVTGYRITDVVSVRRDQIETLASDRPSLVIVLVDGDPSSPQRRVVVADAIQEVPMP